MITEGVADRIIVLYTIDNSTYKICDWMEKNPGYNIRFGGKRQMKQFKFSGKRQIELKKFGGKFKTP